MAHDAWFIPSFYGEKRGGFYGETMLNHNHVAKKRLNHPFIEENPPACRLFWAPEPELRAQAPPCHFHGRKVPGNWMDEGMD